MQIFSGQDFLSVLFCDFYVDGGVFGTNGRFSGTNGGGWGKRGFSAVANFKQKCGVSSQKNPTKKYTPLLTNTPLGYILPIGGKVMEQNCCNKKTKRGAAEKKLIINRLNRISGQINGISKMVENDAYCNDVLVQLSAAKNAIKSLSTYVLENHLYTCVPKALEDGELETIDELISLFKRFNQ